MKAQITIDEQVLHDLEISEPQLEEAVRNALGTLINPDTGDTLYFSGVSVSTVIENRGVGKSGYGVPGGYHSVKPAKAQDAAASHVSSHPPTPLKRELVDFSLQSRGEKSSGAGAAASGLVGVGKKGQHGV